MIVLRILAGILARILARTLARILAQSLGILTWAQYIIYITGNVHLYLISGTCGMIGTTS